MDYDPINWYPEPVPIGLQTPTIYVPPSSGPYYPPTTVPYYPPTTAPYYPPSPVLYYLPLTSSPSTVPQNLETVLPAALQNCFAAMQQAFTEFNHEFTSGIRQIQDKLKERSVLLRQLQDSLPKSEAAATQANSGTRYAPDDPTLPSPWKGLIDGSSGSLYYWNPETNKTQYERPCQQAPPVADSEPEPPANFSEPKDVNLTSSEPTKDVAMVPIDAIPSVATLSAAELDTELVSINHVSSMLEPLNHDRLDVAPLMLTTVNASEKPAQLPMVTLDKPDNTTNHQFPPQPGGLYSMSLSSIMLNPLTHWNAPENDKLPKFEKDIHGLSVVAENNRYDKLADSFVLFNSILPSGEEIQSVSVCQPNFKIQQMTAVELHALVGLLDNKVCDILDEETSKLRAMSLDELWDDSGGLCLSTITIEGLCKLELVTGYCQLVYVDNHILGICDQTAIISHFPKLLSTLGNCSSAIVLTSNLQATLLIRKLVETYVISAVSSLIVQFLWCRFTISASKESLGAAILQVSPSHWKVRLKVLPSGHKINFESDMLISNVWNLIARMPIHAQPLFVLVQSATSVLHCFGLVTSLKYEVTATLPLIALLESLITVVGISSGTRDESCITIPNDQFEAIVTSCCSFGEDVSVHYAWVDLAESNVQVRGVRILSSESRLSLQGYHKIGTIDSTMTIIDLVGETCNHILPRHICNSIFAADLANWSLFVLALRTIVIPQYVVLLFLHILLYCSYNKKNTCKSALGTTNVADVICHENQLLISVLIQEMTFCPRAQYWTSCIWATLDVNRSGSTFYCRYYYRVSLLRKWGARDVTACGLCASYLMESENVDGTRLCVTLSSASGYTATTSLAFQETFNVGASLYGVADLILLRKNMCCLDFHYMDYTIGHDHEFLDVSSINLHVQCYWPMMFFHGLDDMMVLNTLLGRHSSATLLSRGNGVVLMIIMHMMEYVYNDMFFLATNASVLCAPFHAPVRKLFSLSCMAAVQILHSVLAHGSTGNYHCDVGVMMPNSTLQLVSLKCKKQWLEIWYGDENYCSQLSCYPPFLEFLITWSTESNFVAMDREALALVPHSLVSITIQSNAALLLILLSTIIHYLVMEFVISSHLLHGLIQEASRAFLKMQFTNCLLPNSNLDGTAKQPTVDAYMIQAFVRAISTFTKDNINLQFMVLVPRDECQAHGLVILPLLYKLVIQGAIQRTWVLHVLRDYASSKSIIGTLVAMASSFADQPMFMHKMQVFRSENVREHALSIPQQKVAQVILFHLYIEEYLILLPGSPVGTTTYKWLTPSMVQEDLIEADFMLIVIQDMRMITAAVTWDDFLLHECVRHEGTPYSKGGGMLGLCGLMPMWVV